jgi:2-furoate---CoA ligase
VNLALTLLAAADRRPEAEALVDGDTRLTYRELLDRAARLAGGLAQLGLRPGEPLCALLTNRHETVELYWATQWLGAVFTPLNFRLSGREVGYCVRDCGARLVVCEPASADAARAATDDGDSITLIAIDADDPATTGETSLHRLRDSDSHPGTLDRGDDQISLMLYTSGTTGKPKGVPRSHRADRASGLSQVIHHGLDYGERTLGVMPLYHTMGIHSMIAMALIDGCFVAMPTWDADGVGALIERERLTSLYLAPTLYHDLLARLPDDADTGTVRSIGYAGSPMSPELATRCLKAFANAETFFNHYGSTEYYTWAIGRNQADKPGCAGRPAVNSRLRLIVTDPDAGVDDVVDRGDDGQVIADLRSDEAFSGYHHRPDADERAIRDGWYFTGDIGHIDSDGDLWIVGRVDDMIITGGENVHPVEVEDVLAEHPAVVEAAVIGAPDERWGQRVVAFVVPTEDPAATPDADALDRHFRETEGIAGFKRPREYRFVDQLPKSSSGKLLRRELRKELDE